MAVWEKNAPRIFAFLSLMVLFLPPLTALADEVATSQDVQTFIQRAKLAAEIFMQESFQLRMQYEYSGRFLNPLEKEKLRELAGSTTAGLQQIANDQRKLKRQVEDYQGGDWEQRYGKTGLWRQVHNDIYATELAKCRIDYYSALAAEQPERNEILLKILGRIDSLNQTYKQSGPTIIKGKVLALLGTTQPSYKTLAVREFESFAEYSDILQPVSAAVEKIKLTDLAEPNELNALVEILGQSSFDTYPELILSLMFLQRRHDPAGLEETLKIWPQAQGILGPLALADLSHRIATNQNLTQTSAIEAELAAYAAWQEKPYEYRELLERLAESEKTRTSLTVYVAAVSLAESEPVRSTGLLIEAAQLQQKQPSELLELFPAQIASQASYLAYSLFVYEPNQCRIVLEVFDSYATLAKGKMLEELEYLYATVLKDCGQVDKSTELLQKIAEKSSGHWAEVAKLELMAQTIHGKKYEPQRINGLLERFKNSIVQSRNCDYAPEAMHLLAEAVVALEQFAEDDSGFVSNCKELARFCFDCLEGDLKQKAALLLVEVSVFQLPQQSALADFEQFLESLAEDNMHDNVDFIRCSARLAIAQQKFDIAAKLWSEIAQITKDDTAAAGTRTWKWWRAKYYELYCWANHDPAQKQQIIHNLEVLQNSFSGIPAVWDEKLDRLKQEIK
ncbi:MAG: hypothetical protein ACYS18_07550 [Planctomycetota bacterium]